MEGSSNQHFQNQHKGLGFGTINFSDFEGLQVPSFKNADVLSQEVQNLALKGGPVVVSKDGKHRKQNYPVRPEADNCTYFMRYGWCKFGFNCRFNHPFNRRVQVAQANKEMTKPGEENLNRMGQVECKNYLKPEGCKNEKACRYNHSGCKTAVAPVLEFNFLGLPIRPGEKECPQYRRNGSCKYGSNCWFDHPDHSSMGGGFSHSGYTGFEDTCWSLAGPVNGIGPFDPYMYQPAQFSPYFEWIEYQENSEDQSPQVLALLGLPQDYQWPLSIQVPLEHHEAPVYTTSGRSETTPPAFSKKTLESDATSVQQHKQRVLVKESPKANVLPERSNKSGFGFQHPKTSSCPLNDKGLPLRPDTEVCAFYCLYGVCKHGPACKFHHPVTLRKSVPAPGSEEAQVPAPGFEGAQVPAAGSREAQLPQLPEPTNEDKI